MAADIIKRVQNDNLHEKNMSKRNHNQGLRNLIFACTDFCARKGFCAHDRARKITGA